MTLEFIIMRGGDGAVDKTHALGVRDPGSAPHYDTNVSLSKTKYQLNFMTHMKTLFSMKACTPAAS